MGQKSLSTLGNRIRKLRIVNKLKQKELGDLIGVSAQVISNWERSYSFPDNEDTSKLAGILQTSTDYLLGRVEDVFSNQLKKAARPDILANQNQLSEAVQNQHPTFDLIKLINSSYGIVVNDQPLSDIERKLLISTINSMVTSITLIKKDLLDQVKNETDIRFSMGPEGTLIRL
ncbi:helix-turn-helix domain-containing protein [Paenibacillus sp. FSL R7-0333]|uniref:helix-turn-helix domain-containing protein n=1 Tax=Paenibacillus sp. FSL R7-0333 TaxID=1926587 RepID=UPI00096D8E46|nr:hypothetical protein BK146_24615 [Paenibacillus sp. FSL R7-0333]